MDIGHWEYPSEFNVDEWFGFIYRVIDTTNDKEYIGKKQFFSTTTKAVVGKKRRKKTVKQSNWKAYTTSSTYVNDAMVLHGKGSFIFLIESLHATKASLHYAEIEAQVMDDVLRARLPNGERKFYNAAVSNVKFIVPEETEQERTQKVLARTRSKSLNPDIPLYNTMGDDERDMWDAHYHITAGKQAGDHSHISTYGMDAIARTEWKDHRAAVLKAIEDAKPKPEKPKKKAKPKAKAKPKPKVSAE